MEQRNENGAPTVFIRQPEVLRRTALSRSMLYELIEAGRFPKPLKLGQRLNCWPEADIENWLRARLSEARGAERGEA